MLASKIAFDCSQAPNKSYFKNVPGVCRPVMDLVSNHSQEIGQSMVVLQLTLHKLLLHHSERGESSNSH